LTFEGNETNGSIIKEGELTYLPTVDYVSKNMMASVSSILDKLNQLPLERLVEQMSKVVEESRTPIANANEVLEDLRKSVKDLNKMTAKKSFKRMPDEVDRALKELTRTLRVAKKTMKDYDSDALITRQITDTLKTVKKTSEEMREFLKMLNRKPNSLIFGDK
jgi:paraquat-inducible protein B